MHKVYSSIVMRRQSPVINIVINLFRNKLCLSYGTLPIRLLAYYSTVNKYHYSLFIVNSPTLCLRGLNNSLTWTYSKDGLYSTKTTYMLDKGGDIDAFHMAWMEILDMETPPNVKHFWWWLFSNNE